MKMRYPALLPFLAAVLLTRLSRAQAPVFTVTPVQSSIKFSVKASVSIVGNFDKWDAKLTFASPDVTTGVLYVEIQAAWEPSEARVSRSVLREADGAIPSAYSTNSL